MQKVFFFSLDLSPLLKNINIRFSFFYLFVVVVVQIVFQFEMSDTLFSYYVK